MIQRLIAVVSLVVGGVAYAQPGQTPPTAPPVGDPTLTPGSRTTLDPDVRDYDAAVELFIAGDLGTAASRLDDIARRAGDPELASKARELSRVARVMVQRKLARTPPSNPSTPSDRSDADKDDLVDGRTNFVVWSTLYGLYGGIVFVDAAGIDDLRGGVLMVTGTTALGLFGSYLASNGHTMTGAMADAYSLGMLEGATNVALLAQPIGLHGDKQTLPAVLAGGGLAAVGGLVYGANTSVTRGQVSFAGTLSMLGAASTALGIGVAKPDLDQNAWLTTVTVGTDAGLLAGVGLGHGRGLDWSVSRGRIVQLGVLLGGLVGLATGVLINGDDAERDDGTRIVCATTLAGIWGGFGIAWRATSNMRPDRAYAPPSPASPTLAPMPVPGGAGAMLVGGF